MLERLMPEPEPPRKILPSLVFQSRIDSIVSSTERMKQAEHCGCSSKPTLNQTGELNAASWLSRMKVSSASKRVAVLDRGEVAALTTPVGDRAGDARDHLLDRALARRRVELAAEVLLGDDVRRVLRPRLRELDVLLLERDLVAVADARVARLPLDLVEGVDARLREQPLDTQRLSHAGLRLERCVWRRLHQKTPLPFRPVCRANIAEIRGLGRLLRAPDGLEEPCKSGPSF